MSNATISSIGQVNSSGTADALFLKVFSNEVLTQFIRENQMLGMSTVRTLGQGAKSSAFPVTGFVTQVITQQETRLLVKLSNTTRK